MVRMIEPYGSDVERDPSAFIQAEKSRDQDEERHHEPVRIRRARHAVGDRPSLTGGDRLTVSQVGDDDERPSPERSHQRDAGHVHEHPLRNHVVQRDADQHEQRGRRDARRGDLPGADLPNTCGACPT